MALVIGVLIKPGWIAFTRHDVERAEFLDRGGQQARDILGIGHVALDRARHLSPQSLLRVTRIQIAHHDAGALTHEGLGDGEPDSLRASGDDGDAACEKRHRLTFQGCRVETRRWVPVHPLTVDRIVYATVNCTGHRLGDMRRALP
jgi:hypothetical protein